MSATFACPHCQAVYPRRPVLVGKVVRCTACKNPFRLREDGIADKVEDAAPLPAPAPPKPADPFEVTTGEIVKPIKPASQSVARTSTGKSNRELTAQQEAARRAMSATLQETMAKALATESVKQEQTKTIERKAKTARQQGQDPKLGPAVLTGEGEREARESRKLLLGVVGAIAVIVLLAVLLSLRSPVRQGLDAYCEPVPANRNAYPQRALAIRERAWVLEAPGFGPVMPFIDLRDAQTAAAVAVPAEALRAFAAKVAKHDPVPGLDAWTAPGQVTAIQALASEGGNTLAIARKAEAKKLPFITKDQLLAELGAAGVPDDLRGAVFAALFEGRDLPRQLEEAQAIELATFSGRDGTLLVDAGRPPYKPQPFGYRGVLLRVIGAQGTGPWRVLALAAER